MAVENAADRATFFNTEEHGVVAVINSTNVDGIFDEDYIVALDVEGTDPVFVCATSDLDAIAPTVDRGTSLTVNSASFIIERLKPDGTGVTVLILSSA